MHNVVDLRIVQIEDNIKFVQLKEYERQFGQQIVKIDKRSRRLSESLGIITHDLLDFLLA